MKLTPYGEGEVAIYTAGEECAVVQQTYRGDVVRLLQKLSCGVVRA